MNFNQIFIWQIRLEVGQLTEAGERERGSSV